MNTIINCHGFYFNMQGDGFSRAAAPGDFDRIVAKVERYLDRRVAKFVGAIHAASVIDAETGECRDAALSDRLFDIVNRASVAVMASWHNPNGAFVSISAVGE